MSNYDHHNKAFDYAPLRRGGSGKGGLLLIGGIVVLFILAMVVLSPGTGTVAPDGVAPTVAPVNDAPAIQPNVGQLPVE